MSESKSDSKPVYKKAWFWVVIIIGVICVGVVVGNSNNGPTKVDSGDGSSVDAGKAESGAQDFKTGDTIKIDNQEVTVTSVERGYTTGNKYVTPASGKEFVKVNLQIKNTSGDKKDYNALYWKIEDESGDINDYMSAAMAQADDSLNSGELAAGGAKSGSIVFEVPAGSTQLKLHFSPNLFSSEEAVINL